MQKPNRILLHVNRERKKEFRISTSIAIDNQTKIVLKYPDNDESITFLREIVKRDKLALEYFSDYANVITGIIKRDSISYPYLSKPTLENIIRDAIEKGDKNFGAFLIKTYIDFIEKLPSTESLPKGFIAAIGIDPHQIKKPLRCLNIAPIDCIPCNILVDKKKWVIIDNEWTFDFPMPTNFLIYRAIYSLIINLQEIIQINISKERPAYLFCGYGKNRTYIPLSWLNLLKKREISIQRFYIWELLFKRKVFVKANLGRLRLKSRSKPVSKVISNSMHVIFENIMRKMIKNKFGFSRNLK